MTHYQVPGEETSINLTNISEKVYWTKQTDKLLDYQKMERRRPTWSLRWVHTPQIPWARPALSFLWQTSSLFWTGIPLSWEPDDTSLLGAHTGCSIPVQFRDHNVLICIYAFVCSLCDELIISLTKTIVKIFGLQFRQYCKILHYINRI